jgi:hypothetical protein
MLNQIPPACVRVPTSHNTSTIRFMGCYMCCTAQNKLRTFVLTLPCVATFPALYVATQVDGLSHVVHSEEEALGTGITIDSLTCLLANESDPSRLIASSPGKLIRYLLPDGSHVKTDQPYAEVEVSCWQTHAVHAEIMSYVEYISC